MNLLKYIYIFFINLIIAVFASLPSVGWILLSYLYECKLNLFILFGLSQHCKLKMKYKMTPALKHIMLAITSYIHIALYTLQYQPYSKYITRTTLYKESYCKSRIHSIDRIHQYNTIWFKPPYSTKTFSERQNKENS